MGPLGRWADQYLAIAGFGFPPEAPPGSSPTEELTVAWYAWHIVEQKHLVETLRERIGGADAKRLVSRAFELGALVRELQANHHPFLAGGLKVRVARQQGGRSAAKARSIRLNRKRERTWWRDYKKLRASGDERLISACALTIATRNKVLKKDGITVNVRAVYDYLRVREQAVKQREAADPGR